jgi:hypothetical protein
MNYLIAGMLFLLGALLVYLWLAVQRLAQALHALEQRIAPPAAAQPAPAPSAPAAISEDIVAAIAAAVAVTIRRPHHIIAIHPDPNVQRAWSSEGRREIYRSHRIR